MGAYHRAEHMVNTQPALTILLVVLFLIGICETTCSHNWIHEWLSHDFVTHEKFARVSLSVWSAMTKYRRLAGLHSKYRLLTFWRQGSPRSGSQNGWVMVRALFLACRWPPSPCILTWLGESTLVCLPPFVRVQIPSQGPQPHDLI